MTRVPRLKLSDKQPISVFKKADSVVMLILRGRNGFQRIPHDKNKEFSEFFTRVHKQLLTLHPPEKFRFVHNDTIITPSQTPKDLGITHTAVIYLEIETDTGFNLYFFLSDFVRDNIDTRMPPSYQHN